MILADYIIDLVIHLLTRLFEVSLKQIFSIMKDVNDATYPTSRMANGPVKFCRDIIFSGFFRVSKLAWPAVFLVMHCSGKG